MMWSETTDKQLICEFMCCSAYEIVKQNHLVTYEMVTGYLILLLGDVSTSHSMLKDEVLTIAHVVIYNTILLEQQLLIAF